MMRTIVQTVLACCTHLLSLFENLTRCIEWNDNAAKHSPLEHQRWKSIAEETFSLPLDCNSAIKPLFKIQNRQYLLNPDFSIQA